MAVLGSGSGRGNNNQDEENAPLVLSPDRAARRSSNGISPLAAGRAAWFGSSVGGARNEQTHTHAGQPPPQSYGAFVKSTNHGSMGTASSQRGEDVIASSSTPGGSRLHRLRDHWPVLVELMASYVVVLAGFSSHSSPWVVGLVFAGLAHATSTSTYYLQANPMLTLGQLLRSHIPLPRACVYWSAQFLGVTLATLTFTLSNGHGHTHSATTAGLVVVVPLTSCKSLSWGQALFTLSLFSSVWVYVALAAWDSMALALESCCSFYGLATGAAYAAATACIQSRGIASSLLNTWVAVLGLINAAVGKATTTPTTVSPRFVSSSTSSVGCDVLFIVGPLLGCVLGVVLSWLTSLNGSEKQAFLRSMSPMAPLLVETVGVIFLVITLGSAHEGLTTGIMALALTLCAWRRSGAQFNPSITLTIFLLKRQMFRWTSLLFYVCAHVCGAVIGVCLLVLLPLARDMPPVNLIDEPVVLGVRNAVLLLVFATAFLCVFVSNTDAEYDEGFLHPALMVGLSFTGLLCAFALNSDADIIQTGLFNPAVTLVLWTVSKAGVGVVVGGTVIQVVASMLAFGVFWGKAQVEN